jgi:carbonic anhydrase/acetyltransferase-like protein (isoleucine patch superfamily)
MGSPAKVVREVTDEDRRRIAHAAEVYRARGREYRSLLKPA